LTFLGHVTSITWPFDTVHAISYRCPVVTESRTRAVFEITGLKDIGRPWPYMVTWLHRWRHHSICHMPFPISGHLVPSLYLKPFRRYLHLNITKSRLWPFWVTWRHHSIRHSLFPISGYLITSLYLKTFSRYLHLNITSWLTFLGHVTSSITWPFDTVHAIYYRCSVITESLTRAIFKIAGLKDRPIGITTSTFYGHVKSSFDPL